MIDTTLQQQAKIRTPILSLQACLRGLKVEVRTLILLYLNKNASGWSQTFFQVATTLEDLLLIELMFHLTHLK